MFHGEDTNGRASVLPAKASTVSLIIIVVGLIAGLAQTQTHDKSRWPLPVGARRNSHDNQILRWTLVNNNHNLISKQPALGPQPSANNDKNTVNSTPNIVRTLSEFAHARNIHGREKRSASPEPSASMRTTNSTHVKRQGSTTSSMPGTPPTAPMISPAPTITITTTPSIGGQSDQSTEYATVNYNGLIGVNGTDPYAITTESRAFGLPTTIQILMCLLYGTLAFTAVTSNMIVCYIVLSNQRMRTATNYFIVNLAVGDILMALLCIPFTFPANLIFQFWPFGLSLCVIVSYSQANSVFISAYTMVAISIDKYIAIMHPMRLRMPKNQAKKIILVIWSAALLTSLPTALLSSLAPASPDLSSPQASSTIEIRETTNPVSFIPFETTPTIETLVSQSPRKPTFEDPAHGSTPGMPPGAQEKLQKLSLNQPSGNSSEMRETSTRPMSQSTSSSTSSSSSLRQTQSWEAQQGQYEEQKKYFCQESWTFWPRGKYYYSMALMVLQFVVPLFVLIVTYTRIVVVVWGKRIPGEEDNARDARMARSKRKMIKMVIFCVIAFALTWSPFNALIVIGDIAPEIWENQNIMYIWFITHYLAMCHTITNPLIYIWMNNRFRAGFKQKYARVALEIDRKRARRGPLASSGSINPFANNGNNFQHYTSTMPGSGQGEAGPNATTTTNHFYTTNSTSNHSNNNTLGQRLGGCPGSSSGGSRAVEVGLETHNQASGGSTPRPTQVCKFKAGLARPSVNDQGSSRYWQSQTRERPGQHIELQSLGMTSSGNGRGCAVNQVSDNECSAQPSQSAIKSPSGQKCASLFQRRKRRQIPQNDQKLSLDHERTRGMGVSMPSSEGAATSAGAKRKRRRRQTHAVCLQMTTSQFYSTSSRPAKEGQLAAGAIVSSLAGGRGAASGCKKRPAIFGGDRIGKAGHKRPIDYPHDCPSCHQARVSPLCTVPLPSLPPSSTTQPYASSKEGGCVRYGQFLVDTRQSSQSTATISAQTNNTSLAISPISSTRGAISGGVQTGDPGNGNPASNGNSNNTSASLSAAGLSGEHSKDAEGVQGDSADERPDLKRVSSGNKAGLDESQMQSCATDDDADDNSINSHAVCAPDDGGQTIGRKIGSTAKSEVSLRWPDNRPNVGQSNNLKLVVTVGQVGHSPSSCPTLAAPDLQSPAGFQSIEIDYADNTDRSPHLSADSPSRVLSTNGHKHPSDDHSAIVHAKEINTAQARNKCKLVPLSGSVAWFNESRGTTGADTLPVCNQSATGLVLPRDFELAKSCHRHQQQRMRRRRRRDRTASHQQSATDKSQRGVRLNQQRFCLEHRQTASALEVDQLRHERDSNTAPNRICDNIDATNANRDSQIRLGNDKLDPHGRSGGVHVEHAFAKLRGTKSKSALELMSDFLLRAERRNGPSDCALLTDYNELSDDHDAGKDYESDQPLSPWTMSDNEHALTGYGGSCSPSDEETDENDDESARSSDSPDRVRLMLWPINGIQKRRQSDQNVGLTGRHLNVSSQTTDGGLVSSAKGSAGSNLNHCSTAVTLAHYQVQTLTGAKSG